MSKSSTKTRIQTPKEEFIVDYHEALEFMNQQAHHFWPHDEIKVHKDKHDVLVNMTEAERHGTVTTLKLFTLYEQIIGDEFWLNFVFKKFPRPADIQPMASLFAAVELAVHGHFYAKINEELGLANEEFYNSYLDDPDLKQRIDYLHSTLYKSDDLRALGGFTFGEGAILYSSFAFLKHFQSQGKNKLLNVVSGINFSCHSEDTEVLTSEGWVPIADVNTSHNVAQFDENTHEITYANPTNTVQTSSTESYTFESDSFSQRVTPEHRMVTTNGIIRAEHVDDVSEQYIGGTVGDGIKTVSAEEYLALQMISNGDLSEEWFYNKIQHVTSFWAQEALSYINKRDKGMKDIINTLVAISGTSTSVVEKTKNEHETQSFYCLEMPKGTFIVKRNGKVSISGNCRDENLHAEAAAYLYRTLMAEQLEAGIIDDVFCEELKKDIFTSAETVMEHEKAIISKIFEKGPIEGITAKQLENFTKSRINFCLRNLGYEDLYEITYNPIAETFYKGINGYQMTDFFSSQGNQYSRGWSKTGFTLKGTTSAE